MSKDALTTATCPTQRWRMGRDYWRVDRDEGFRKNDYSVDVISDSAARRFVVEHHYSGSYPIAVERIGLFRGLTLVGVCVFSIPISSTAIAKYTGLGAKQGVELGRFVLLDEVPYNAETHFLSGAFKALRSLRPDILSVLAYSDPMPRTSSTGRIILPGHIGIAYQAGNARYFGRAAAKTLHLTPHGHALSTRAVSKVRLQEHGASSAEKLLVRMGAPARKFGQDPAEWINAVLASDVFVRVRHPGNLVYGWALGQPKMKQRLQEQFAPSKSYPKQHDPMQTGFDIDKACP
jgi:hypothetical protein